MLQSFDKRMGNPQRLEKIKAQKTKKTDRKMA